MRVRRRRRADDLSERVIWDSLLQTSGGYGVLRCRWMRRWDSENTLACKRWRQRPAHVRVLPIN